MSRYGLFVGVDNYANGITPLKCAKNDAQQLYNFFINNGFKAKFMSNQEVTYTSFFETLAQFKRKLEPGDIFVFYFSGHGCEDNNEHYLLPHDTTNNRSC